MSADGRRNHHWSLLVDETLAARFFGLYLILLLTSFLLSHCAVHRWRCGYLSEAGITLGIGFLGGGILQLLVMEDKADRYGEVEVRDMLVSFSSAVLFTMLLPPIIFNSGYRMRGNFFWANIDKILTLAFAGTFVSSVVVGVIFYAGQGALSEEVLSLAESLTFGALISATDPVPTLAVLEQLRVDPHLESIIFGESVLNDAVGIVLFHTFARCIGYDGPPAGMVLHLAVRFVTLFVGSALVGALMGAFSAWLFKHLRLHLHAREHGTHLELAVFLVFSYAPYLLAEVLNLSGTVAILFTGVAMRRYTYGNLSQEAQVFAETLVSLVSHVAESFVFIDLGTSAWQAFRATPALTIWAGAACLVARAAHVYPIGWLLNSLPITYPRRKIETAQMHMVWLSGIRGAIAYALSTQFPGPHRQCVMSITMTIVLCSTWVMGGATVPAIRRLGIRQMQPDQMQQLKLTLEPAVNRLSLVHWDRRYLRPWLVRGAPEVSPTSTEDDVPSSARAFGSFGAAPALGRPRGALGAIAAARQAAARFVRWHVFGGAAAEVVPQTGDGGAAEVEVELAARPSPPGAAMPGKGAGDALLATEAAEEEAE